MKFSSVVETDERKEYVFGVSKDTIYFIPYTGWGNSVTKILYKKGILQNEPYPYDWQWGDEDGEVFKTLDEAIDFAGYPVDKTLAIIPNPKKAGGISFEPELTGLEILKKLSEGAKPEELNMKSFSRVSAAKVGGYWFGGMFFTQYECKENDWAMGRVSENGVSLRISYKTVNGQLWKAEWAYDHLGRGKPTKTFTSVNWDTEIQLIKSIS